MWPTWEVSKHPTNRITLSGRVPSKEGVARTRTTWGQCAALVVRNAHFIILFTSANFFAVFANYYLSILVANVAYTGNGDTSDQSGRIKRAYIEVGAPLGILL